MVRRILTIRSWVFCTFPVNDLTIKKKKKKLSPFKVDWRRWTKALLICLISLPHITSLPLYDVCLGVWGIKMLYVKSISKTNITVFSTNSLIKRKKKKQFLVQTHECFVNSKQCGQGIQVMARSVPCDFMLAIIFYFLHQSWNVKNSDWA